MLPMRPVRLQLGELLAADATTLAPVTGNKVALVMDPFTPEETMVPGSLTLATFDGSTPIVAGTGTQPAGLDPATGDQIITIKEPAGGFRWETSGVTNLPQTIYGYALLTNDLATLLAVATLPTPVTLQIAGQQINLGPIGLNIVQSPIS